MGPFDRLAGLDELRGLAIALVVISHLGPALGTDDGGTALLAPAWSVGVDLLFVISGLVVERSLRQLAERCGWYDAIVVFYVRRAARILPLAWIVAGILGMLIWVPAAGVLVSDVTAAMTFTSNAYWAACFSGAGGCGNPFVFGPYWSIATEVQFYLLAPLLVFALPPRAMTWLAVAVLFIGIFLYRPWGGTLWTLRVDAILVGVLLGRFLETEEGRAVAGRLRPIGNAEALFWMGIAATMLALLPAILHGAATVIVALLSGWIVARAMRRGASVNPLGRAFAGLGYVSYALYLAHLPVLTLVIAYVKPDYGVGWAVIAAIVTAIGVAWFLTANIGEPMRRMGRLMTGEPKEVRT